MDDEAASKGRRIITHWWIGKKLFFTLDNTCSTCNAHMHTEFHIYVTTFNTGVYGYTMCDVVCLGSVQAASFFYICLCSWSNALINLWIFLIWQIQQCSRGLVISLPAQPVSCVYCSKSCDGPQWTTLLTLGQSRPIPNATVAITTHEGLQYGILNRGCCAAGCKHVKQSIFC